MQVRPGVKWGPGAQRRVMRTLRAGPKDKVIYSNSTERPGPNGPLVASGYSGQLTSGTPHEVKSAGQLRWKMPRSGSSLGHLGTEPVG